MSLEDRYPWHEHDNNEPVMHRHRGSPLHLHYRDGSIDYEQPCIHIDRPGTGGVIRREDAPVITEGGCHL